MISQTVRNEIRGNDVFARLGGDEFALLIQDVEFESAHEIIGRIQRKVNEEIKKMKWSISLSIGCKVFSSPSSTIGPMLKQVDDLMFEVKKSGKNSFKIVAQTSDDK